MRLQLNPSVRSQPAYTDGQHFMPSDREFGENIQRFADALMTAMAKRGEFERLGAVDHVRIINVVQFALLWNADPSVSICQGD